MSTVYAAAVLTNPQKKYLRKLGHEIEPIVRIGKEGLTDGVVHLTKTGLLAHELIKAKVNTNSDQDRDDVFEALASAAEAQLVFTIGRVGLLYKPHPEKPVIVLPR